MSTSPPASPDRLLLCDDHAVVRAGLRALLSSADPLPARRIVAAFTRERVADARPSLLRPVPDAAPPHILGQ